MLENQIYEIITDTVTDMGMSVVRVSVSGDRNKTVQVMIEQSDGSLPTIEQCAKVGKALSTLFDVHDIINEKYFLEVSSPGMDRPLVKFSDYERFCGRDIKLELTEPIDGRKRFKGKLVAAEDDSITLLSEEQEFKFEFNNIHKAKLIITDDLLKKGLKK